MSKWEVWFRAPAKKWVEALPLGNGRLGAMVFGSVEREHLQLNEDTLYSGGPYSPVNPEARGRLDEVRQLINDGSYALAEALADRFMMAVPIKQMSYQPAGDLWLDFDHQDPVEDYRRALDLDTAVATTTYSAGGVVFRREIFSSAADNVLVTRLSADRPGSVSFVMRLTSEQPGSVEAIAEDTLDFSGTNRGEQGVRGALKYAMRAKVITDGVVRATRDGIRVEGAYSALILLDIGTSFRRFDDVSGDPVAALDERLAAAARKGFDELLPAHVAEHQRLFRRLDIDLGTTEAAALPTVERVEKNGENDDPALAALYVQFGRYLMISASRPGTQPANLQGIWNDLTNPPWGSKYTSNINIQMNYWLPDPANIAECFEPLIAMVEDLSVTGREMAREHYGARGWVLHHNTDLWRATGPVDGAKWGLWPTGGAWYCAQLYDSIAYSAYDPELLRRLYPVMRGAAEFILDYLQPLPGTDFLVTNPAVSPENIHPHGSSLCAGPTMDNQLIRDLFDAVSDASQRLGVDEALQREIQAARSKIPPDKIGKAGQLQEWMEDWDMEVPEIHHRHVSHLYGLYPSQQIDVDRTPQLADAARKSLEIRGDDATGWGIGWRINLWARLRDGNHAHRVVSRLLAPDRTYPNLFDAHPPFQIDGNFGGAAGILEMLVQSGDGFVHLLPALPDAWPTGSLRGVRARGGYVLDVAWKDGILTEAKILSRTDSRVEVRYSGLKISVELAPESNRSLSFVHGSLVVE